MLRMIFARQRGNSSTGAYHEFLSYTDDNGFTYYARGGPNGIPTTASATFGRIVTSYGIYTVGTPDYPTIRESGQPTLDTPTFNSYYKYTVVQGPQSELSGVWQQITNNLAAIGAEDLSYFALTQNSNSVVSEALRLSGLTAPDASDFGVPWAGELGLPNNQVLLPWAPGTQNTLQSDDQTIVPLPGIPAGDASGFTQPALGQEVDHVDGAGNLVEADEYDQNNNLIEKFSFVQNNLATAQVFNASGNNSIDYYQNGSNVIPTTGSLSIVDAVNVSAICSETVSNSTGGAVSFKMGC